MCSLGSSTRPNRTRLSVQLPDETAMLTPLPFLELQRHLFPTPPHPDSTAHNYIGTTAPLLPQALHYGTARRMEQHHNDATARHQHTMAQVEAHRRGAKRHVETRRTLHRNSWPRHLHSRRAAHARHMQGTCTVCARVIPMRHGTIKTPRHHRSKTAPRSATSTPPETSPRGIIAATTRQQQGMTRRH